MNVLQRQCDAFVTVTWRADRDEVESVLLCSSCLCRLRRERAREWPTWTTDPCLSSRPSGRRWDRPDDAVGVNVEASRREALDAGLRVVPRQLVPFRQSGSGRVRARVQPDDGAGEAEHRAPDGAVGGTHGNAIKGGRYAFVLRRIDRLIGLHIIVALAVAVGIENQRRPALRFLLIMSLFEHLRVEPSDYVAAAAAAGPQGAVGIFGELQMVRAEAGVDERELFGFGVVHGELAAAPVQRKQFRRGLTRSLFAEGRVIRRTDDGGEPDAPLFIEHGVMHVGLTVPDGFLSPVRGWAQRLRWPGRLGIADRHFHLARRMAHRVEDGHVVGAELRSPV